MFTLFMYNTKLKAWIYVDTFELEKDAYTISFNMSRQGFKTEVTTNSYAIPDEAI